MYFFTVINLQATSCHIATKIIGCTSPSYLPPDSTCAMPFLCFLPFQPLLPQTHRPRYHGVGCAKRCPSRAARSYNGMRSIASCSAGKVKGSKNRPELSRLTQNTSDPPQSQQPHTYPMTNAEHDLIKHTAPLFSDARYGTCPICARPLAVPGLVHALCPACGWVDRRGEDNPVTPRHNPGHHV